MSILPGINSPMKHLSDIDPKLRESESIFRFFCVKGCPFQIAKLSPNGNYVVGMNIPFTCIMTRAKLAEHNLKDGDIDICLIPLNENFQIETNIVTPDLDNIIGIEVKTMVLANNDEIISPKNNQPAYREQTVKLCQMGFNDVKLLYIVPTEPLAGSTGSFQDCVTASLRANLALEKIAPIILTDDSDLFSTLGFSFGIVGSSPGGHDGGQCLKEYYKVRPNILKDRSNPFRQAFEKKVEALFPYEIEHTRFPIQMRGCRKCRKLFLFPQGETPVCPKCKCAFALELLSTLNCETSFLNIRKYMSLSFIISFCHSFLF